MIVRPDRGQTKANWARIVQIERLIPERQARNRSKAAWQLARTSLAGTRMTTIWWKYSPTSCIWMLIISLNKSLLGQKRRRSSKLYTLLKISCRSNLTDNWSQSSSSTATAWLASKSSLSSSRIQLVESSSLSLTSIPSQTQLRAQPMTHPLPRSSTLQMIKLSFSLQPSALLERSTRRRDSATRTTLGSWSRTKMVTTATMPSPRELATPTQEGLRWGFSRSLFWLKSWLQRMLTGTLIGFWRPN